MPYSNSLHIPAVAHFIWALKPKRILDIGIGMGTYGYLARMLLDITEQRVDRATWEHRIEGVEGFMGYKNPVWDYAYDEVHSGDAAELIKTLPEFDMIICIDVLEHFEQNVAHAFMENCMVKSPILVATTPNVHIPQEDWGGNAYETHRSFLTAKNFPHLLGQGAAGITDWFFCARPDARSQRVIDAVSSTPILTFPKVSLVHRIKRKLRRMSSGK